MATEHRHNRLSKVNQTFEPRSNEPTSFSLVRGGLLYQVLRRTHLAGDELQLLRRRILVLTMLTWGPLLLLSIVEGRAWGSGVALPFLYDIQVHVRFLLAMPLLLVAELATHRRIRSVVLQFVERRLIPDSGRTTFDAAVASARRLRDSNWPEVFLLAIVYVVGVGVFWRMQRVLDGASWHDTPVNGTWRTSMAGWWLTCVSLPLFQFLLLRWYFRLVFWARFLLRVSGIKLNLVPTHPDRCGGLAFLASTRIAFAPLLLAQGALLAGMIANRILYAGAKLPDFKVELIGFVILMVFAVLGPLLLFCRQLEATKTAGMREYGALAQRYIRDYDQKWLRGGAPPDEPLLGSADIQSLADLSNSFEVMKGMRWVPFTWQTVLQMAVIALMPVVPLLLTMISLQELLDRLIKLVL